MNEPWWAGIDVTGKPGPCDDQCGCALFGTGEDQLVVRRAYRGDSIAFRTQVFQNIRTGRRFTAPVVDPAWPPPPNAVPFSLASGVSRIAVTAKYQVQDQDMIAVFLLDNLTLGGVTIETGALGFFDVLTQPINTRQFPDGPVRLTYDSKLYESSGRVTTIERGHIIILPTAGRAIT